MIVDCKNSNRAVLRSHHFISMSLLARELLSQSRTAGSRRCRVGSGGVNAQLNLRTGIELTPHRQLASHKLGAFAHATHAVVSGAPVFIKMPQVDAFSIIPDPHTKQSFVI